MASVKEATRLLESEFITINSVNVKVTQQDGSEVFEGKHKLIIKNMDFKGTKAFMFMREALEKCSCTDIEVLKKLGSDIEVFEGSGSGGVVNLLFRTKEGRTKALNILNVQKVDMDKNWIFVELNEDDEKIL